MAEMRDLGESGVGIDADCAGYLDLEPGDEVITLPLD
jgi:hypothetical protein